MAKIVVPVKRLVPEAKLPERQHAYDAGWDVAMVSAELTGTAQITNPIYVYGTGLAFAVPEGYWLDIRSRSSVYKMGLCLANGSGVLDANFRGELKLVFYDMGNGWNKPKQFDRIGQLILQPALTTDYEFVEVDELPPSPDDRGEGGFGSTEK